MEKVQSTNELAIAELAKVILSRGSIDAKIGRFVDDDGSLTIITSSLQIIQDVSPSTILTVHFDEQIGSEINFFEQQSHVASVSKIEPRSLQTIWIPIEASEFCERLVNYAIQFSEAGYPGCLDCLGPAYENIWDEVAHRGALDY
jgi:hypothetical protein